MSGLEGLERGDFNRGGSDRCKVGIRAVKIRIGGVRKGKVTQLPNTIPIEADATPIFLGGKSARGHVSAPMDAPKDYVLKPLRPAPARPLLQAEPFHFAPRY